MGTYYCARAAQRHFAATPRHVARRSILGRFGAAGYRLPRCPRPASWDRCGRWPMVARLASRPMPCAPAGRYGDGERHDGIAEAVGISHDGTRWRWSRCRWAA